MFEGVPGKLLEVHAGNAQVDAGGAVTGVRDAGPAGVRFAVRPRAAGMAPLTLAPLGAPPAPAVRIPDHGDQYGTGGLYADGVPVQAVTGGPGGFTLAFYGAVDNGLDGAVLEVGEGHVRCHLRLFFGDLIFQHGGSNARFQGVTTRIYAPGGARIGEPAFYAARVWPDGRAELRRDGVLLGRMVETSILDFTGVPPTRVRIGWKDPGSYLPSRLGVLATWGRPLGDDELERVRAEAPAVPAPQRAAPAGYREVVVGRGVFTGVNAYRQASLTDLPDLDDPGYLWTPSVRGGASGALVRLPSVFSMENPTAGINDFGQVAGSVKPSPDPYRRPYVFTPETPNATRGRLVLLGTLGGWDARAAAINQRGQVVGWSEREGDWRRYPFRWTPDAPNGAAGWMEALQFPGWGHVEALGLNDVGQAVGYRLLPSDFSEAVLWGPDGRAVVLGAFFGLSTRAVAINNRGQVAGWSGSLAGEHRAWVLDLRDGRVTEIPRLDGVPHGSYATSINDAGQVAGASRTAADGTRHRAFVWTPGSEPVRLPTPGVASVARVGPEGWLVGHYHTGEEERAVLWEPVTEPA